MVGNAIDPRPRRTTRIEPLKTPPQLKMDLLDQVATLFRVNLVRPREPFERGIVSVRRAPVQVILARPSVQGIGNAHLLALDTALVEGEAGLEGEQLVEDEAAAGLVPLGHLPREVIA